MVIRVTDQLPRDTVTDMLRLRNLFLIASMVFIIGGLSMVGFAGFQIYSYGSGEKYLPAIPAPLADKTVPEVIAPVKIGDIIGSLSIPRIKAVIPIIEGTGTKELKRGVGHYVGSVVPGVKDNSVLAGHRDSVFRRLGEVRRGDLITVRTDFGKFVYKVDKIRVVEANDRTVIVPTKEAVLTLSTCFPFRFIGAAPQRYIVQGTLVVGKPLPL